MASKSLGTLTLDLVARIGAFTGPLDKASQEAKKRNAEIAKSFDSLAKGVGAAIGSIPAVLTALVVHSASVAKEISNQAALAGLGTTEFQKYAAASKSVGIEQDKLSDIFKDTNDKLGDFMNTGGGALKDFFDNIAPKVGVTAESFKKLNSKEALALYVTSLEKANVNQQEMTFYMEAIADESTALVPLLRNNGKAFDELGQAAFDAGVVMDEKTIAAAKQFGIEMQGLGQYITSGKTMLAAEFLPVLAQFAKDVNSSAKEAGGLKGQVGELGDSLITAAAFMASTGDGITRVFKIVANTLVGTFSTATGYLQKLDASGNAALSQLSFGETSEKFKENAAKMAADAEISFSVARQAAAEINKELETPLAGDRFKQYVVDAKKAAAEIAATNKAVTPGTGSGADPAALEKAKKAATDAASAAKKISDSFKGAETDYMRQIELINTSADAQKNATQVDKLRFEIASGKLVGINAEQKKRLEGLAAELDALEKLKLANEEQIKAASFLANLKSTNATIGAGFDMELAGAGMGDKARDRLKEDLAIQQDYNQQMADLQKQLNANDITKELYDTQTGMLRDALAERMTIQQDYYAGLDEAQADWMVGVSDAWNNYLDQAADISGQSKSLFANAMNGMTDSLTDFVMSGKFSLDDMVTTFARSAINMLIQWGTAQVAMAALNAFTSTAAIPVVGPLAAPAAAASALGSAGSFMSMISSVAGMAHDGIDSVPETGTWLLQKGERVTTAETSAKLDRTLDRVSADGGGGGSPASIRIDAPITVQAQAGMTDQQAQQQGEAMGQAFTAEVIRIIQGETLQGGVLWRRA